MHIRVSGYLGNNRLEEKITNIDSKPCKICHIIKLLAEFSKDSQVKSGVSNRCKSCDKIKNSKRTRKGFTWQDVQQLTTTPEEEFRDLYGKVDVKHKGKWVMKKGKVLDKTWYQRKLRRLEKGEKGLRIFTRLI